MKIVQVSLRFDTPGGVETTVRETARRLRDAGEEVEVFASDLVDEAAWRRGEEFRAEVDGVPVRRFPARKRLLPGLTVPAMVGLIDALAESGADVIHAHSHRYGHVLQAAAVARRTGIPLVVSTHYHPADPEEPPWTRRLLRGEDVLFGASAYRVARALVVESELERRKVSEFAPSAKVRVIPPGVDLAEWENADPLPATPLPPSGSYLLFVGRVAANKGLPTLFQALAQLSAAERPPLVLMGPAWGEQEALEALAAQLGITESVRWLGTVPDRATYRAVLRGARSLVLPSAWEAFGLVLLDAMAAGVPIVASSVGAVPEVLEGGACGRLVPYGVPAALAEALRDTREDRVGTELRVRRASVRVRGLDWARSTERLRAVYRALAA